jgi:predicted glycosyltransferase
VLFHVQHLLGVGHLKRAAAVARACADVGLDVTLVSGGLPLADLDVGGARLRQLPPARSADESFSGLVDENGAPVDEAWRTHRREALLVVLADCKPHVLVLESYPFGRRLLRFELVPLLEAAARQRPRPAIVSSVRDILVPKRKPGRNEEIAEQVERWFDHVLVHGDPALVALERTFPLAARIADRIVYSGYVTETAPGARGGRRGDEVIVSAGGSATGVRLLACALEARSLTRLKDAPWRVLAGDTIAGDVLRRLQEKAPAGVVVERARADFADLIARCALSVSQAGYNTVMTLLQTGTRAVVVPFDRGGESEQMMRAKLLQARGVFELVEEQALAPDTLASAIDATLAAPDRPAPSIDMSGAETSAGLIAGWAKEIAT